MTFFIGAACIDNLDRSCVEGCPVDCIYEGDRKLYINPDECIECGACESACPVQAISSDRKNPDDPHLADNAAFFTEVLVGLPGSLGTPAAPPNSARWVRTPNSCVR